MVPRHPPVTYPGDPFSYGPRSSPSLRLCPHLNGPRTPQPWEPTPVHWPWGCRFPISQGFSVLGVLEGCLISPLVDVVYFLLYLCFHVLCLLVVVVVGPEQAVCFSPVPVLPSISLLLSLVSPVLNRVHCGPFLSLCSPVVSLSSPVLSVSSPVLSSCSHVLFLVSPLISLFPNHSEKFYVSFFFFLFFFLLLALFHHGPETPTCHVSLRPLLLWPSTFSFSPAGALLSMVLGHLPDTQRWDPYSYLLAWGLSFSDFQSVVRSTGCFLISFENKPNWTRNDFFTKNCQKNGKGDSQLALFFEWKTKFF